MDERNYRKYNYEFKLKALELLQAATRARGRSSDSNASVQVESPMDLINRYFQFRALAMPEDEFHALAFLSSELGELSDALVSSAGIWTRNDPIKDRNPELEAGDVLMMLYVTMRSRRIDPFQGMIKKFQSKGFTDANTVEVDH